MIRVGEKFGNFQIQAEIGRGGMGTIYRALDIMLDREVALKVIHPQYANDAELMERFKIEAMTQARMNHPNIVLIFSFNRIDQDYVIAMEYVPGKCLKEILLQKKVYDLDLSIEYVRQILEGLKYSHSLNVIHRDIKPANILIGKENRVKISDFGIAKFFGTQGLTKTGMLIGTPWYTSPEQILGKNIDFRSDLYSLGVTFFEMITGRVPFDSRSNSEFQIQKDHLETPPPLPSRLNPSIPEDVDDFVWKALEKRPENRFQSSREMLEALETIASSRLAATVPYGMDSGGRIEKTRPIIRRTSRVRFRWIFSILFVFAAVLGAAWIFGWLKFPLLFRKTVSREALSTPSITREAEKKREQPLTKEADIKKGTEEVQVFPANDRAEEERKNGTSKGSLTLQPHEGVYLENQPVKTQPNKSSTPVMDKPTVQALETEKKGAKEVIASPSVKAAESGPEVKKEKVPSKIIPEERKTEIPPVNPGNISRLMESGRLLEVEEQIDQWKSLPPDRIPIPLHWIGTVKFYRNKFSEAEMFWLQALNKREWIQLSVTHFRRQTQEQSVGFIKFRPGQVLYNDIGGRHSFFIHITGISTAIPQGIRIDGDIRGKPISEVFALRANIDRTQKEDFLVRFIQKNILQGGRSE